MWTKREGLSGYDRLRMEQPRESLPNYAPRLFYGDIIHKEYIGRDGVVRLIQNNDYEERKRIYFIEIVKEGNKTIRLRTENRKDAGDLYDSHRKELI